MRVRNHGFLVRVGSASLSSRHTPDLSPAYTEGFHCGLVTGLVVAFGTVLVGYCLGMILC